MRYIEVHAEAPPNNVTPIWRKRGMIFGSQEPIIGIEMDNNWEASRRPQE